MKILMCHRPGGAWGYITDGMVNAFRSKGHDVVRWQGDIESFVSFDPDLYIGCSGHRQPIPPNRRAKIAIHVNPYGPVEIGGINENQQNINWVIKQKPNAVFGYGTEDDRILWSYWENRHGIEWVPMPTAADATLFRDLGADRPNDIIYLGGRWTYKALTIDKYLLPVVRNKDLRCAVRGWGDWPDGVCGGPLEEDEVTRFINSGKVGPCISEKHTHEYGIDIPERAFKVAACGTLVVHDAVPTLRTMIPSAVVANNTDDFYEKCVYYAKHDDERMKLAAAQREEVSSAHTYHHRLSNLLSSLGFSEAASDMLV